MHAFSPYAPTMLPAPFLLLTVPAVSVRALSLPPPGPTLPPLPPCSWRIRRFRHSEGSLEPIPHKWQGFPVFEVISNNSDCGANNSECRFSQGFLFPLHVGYSFLQNFNSMLNKLFPSTSKLNNLHPVIWLDVHCFHISLATISEPETRLPTWSSSCEEFPIQERLNNFPSECACRYISSVVVPKAYVERRRKKKSQTGLG